MVSRRVESIEPKAPKRSPSNPPGPVTYGVKLFAFAIGAISSRIASTIAGNTGSSLGKTSPIAFPSSGILARIALPSSEGKAEIRCPGATKSEILASVPARVSAPISSRWPLIAARAAGVAAPSKRTNVGKLNESLPEKVWITSDACVASAPFGKNDELLFSCTEESLPKRGPNTPVRTNQKMTINMAKA